MRLFLKIIPVRNKSRVCIDVCPSKRAAEPTALLSCQRKYWGTRIPSGAIAPILLCPDVALRPRWVTASSNHLRKYFNKLYFDQIIIFLNWKQIRNNYLGIRVKLNNGKKKIYLADRSERACYRNRPWASSKPKGKNVCFGCQRRGAWSIARFYRLGCRRGRSCCPRGRTPEDAPTDRRRAPLPGFPPATGSNADQTRDTDSVPPSFRVRPIKIRSLDETESRCELERNVWKRDVRVREERWSVRFEKRGSKILSDVELKNET